MQKLFRPRQEASGLAMNFDGLGTPVQPVSNHNLSARQVKQPRQETHQQCVRPALCRRRGEPQLQAAAVQPGNLRAPGIGLHVHVQ